MAVPPGVAKADKYRDAQWHLSALDVPKAHKISKGSGITVAVLDTGVYPHGDLKRNLLEGVDLTAGGNRRGQSDTDGHGTNIAALIAAHGEKNNNGVLGIAPSAKILPVKVSNGDSDEPSETLTEGVKWAQSRRVQVMNISFVTGPAFELIDAINEAIENDTIIVAGVGNSRGEAIVGYPAAIEGVLAVGALGRNGNHASLSTTGTQVQICAPGVEMETAKPKNSYTDINGTSAATAIVSGAAALVRSRYPDLSAKEVIHRLIATADDIGPPGRDDQCGFGRLNLVKALTLDVPPLEQSGTSKATGTAPPSSAAPNGSSINAPTAQPEPTSGSNTILFGGLAALLGAGSVLAFLALRRRRP